MRKKLKVITALLLSIATAQWKDKDAREIIHKFVDQINAIDPGFNINKDSSSNSFKVNSIFCPLFLTV